MPTWARQHNKRLAYPDVYENVGAHLALAASVFPHVIVGASNVGEKVALAAIPPGLMLELLTWSAN